MRKPLKHTLGMACTLFVGVGMAVFGAAVAGASSGPINTGNGDTTCGNLDPNWSVQGPFINGGNSEQATILSPSCQNWFGSWAPDNSLSSWLGDTVNNPTGQTPYTFTMSFNLSQLSAISGTWYIDDDGTLNANGHLIDTENDTFNGVPFTIPTGDLNLGLNTITATIVSDNNADDGVRVQFTPPTTTPEPSSLLLVGTSLLGVAGILRRKLFR